MYYIDTSVLLVYTLASGVEAQRYPSVDELFEMIANGQIEALTSFYALHEVYLYALDNAPDFEIGCKFGKEAIASILSTKILVAPLLSRIERLVNERFFRHLSDSTDLPHAISAKVYNCEAIVGYDDHFREITDQIKYYEPEELVS